MPDLINKGVIINHPNDQPTSGGKTFIVTGLHRSGTSLIAAMLRHVGIFMGENIGDAAHEDEDMLAVLRSRDTTRLQQIIAERRANYGTWGFKAPLLYSHLQVEQLALFDNPHLIVPFRDIASISVRNALSEYREVMTALRDAVNQSASLVAFVSSATTPSLLLSYEKALTFRDDFAGSLMQFCGLPNNAALRAELVGLIEPNRKDYIERVRKVFRGLFESVVDGRANGWCQLIGDTAPVMLDVDIDGQPVTSGLADNFRQDLAEAGIGDGKHGFSIPIAPFGPHRDAVIRIRVAGRAIELDNSGRCLADYLARRT